MDLVVDANVLFAALIREGGTVRLLFDKKLRLFAPEYLLEEFARHRETILRKTHRSVAEFDILLHKLSARLELVPVAEIMLHLEQAETVSPDPDDAPYFAAALATGAALWSNDARLKRQERTRVYNTTELYRLLLEEAESGPESPET